MAKRPWQTPRLTELGRDTTMTYDQEARQQRDLARYQALLADARGSLKDLLTIAELSAVLDALNGHWFSEPWSVSYIYAEMEDACRLNGLDQKWHIDGPALVRKLQRLDLAHSMALADAAERWWARVGLGEHQLAPEAALED